MKKNDAPGDQGGIIIRRFTNIAGAQSFNAFLESRGFHTALVGDNDGISPFTPSRIMVFVSKAELKEAKLAAEEYDKLMKSDE